MIPEDTQFDLFSPADEPILLQPVAGCTGVDQQDRIRSPTLNGEQKKLADSLREKSRELVKKSKYFNQNAEIT